MTIEARELTLWIENTELLYSWLVKCNEKLKQFNDYDSQKAPKLFAPLCNEAAKHYCVTFGGRWDEVFSPACRREAAEYFTKCFEEEREV